MAALALVVGDWGGASFEAALQQGQDDQNRRILDVCPGRFLARVWLYPEGYRLDVATFP